MKLVVGKPLQATPGETGFGEIPRLGKGIDLNDLGLISFNPPDDKVQHAVNQVKETSVVRVEKVQTDQEPRKLTVMEVY